MIIRKEKNARMSKVVEHNGLIYFSGIVPTDRTTPVQDQTKQVLNIAEELFRKAGTSKELLLRADIYLRDINQDFASFNTVWDEWVSQENPPARACVQASMSTPSTHVEIIFIAVKA